MLEWNDLSNRMGPHFVINLKRTALAPVVIQDSKICQSVGRLTYSAPEVTIIASGECKGKEEQIESVHMLKLWTANE